MSQKGDREHSPNALALKLMREVGRWNHTRGREEMEGLMAKVRRGVTGKDAIAARHGITKRTLEPGDSARGEEGHMPITDELREWSERYTMRKDLYDELTESMRRTRTSFSASATSLITLAMTRASLLLMTGSRSMRTR